MQGSYSGIWYVAFIYLNLFYFSQLIFNFIHPEPEHFML